MKKCRVFLTLTLCLLFLAPALALRAEAADLDEILRYEITVDVNEDATLHMVYHIDWMVLDSTSEGPLSWVLIGIPNRHCSEIIARSDAVRKIGYTSSGGDNIRVDLDRDYYAGEVAEIEFELVQDYMYDVDAYTDGETVYSFMPGWFDELLVDEFVLKWNGENVLSQSPACQRTSDGYYTWTQPLDYGETIYVTVTYPNDAYAFDMTKTIDNGYDYGGYDSDEDWGAALMGLIFLGLCGWGIAKACGAFRRSANF